MLVTLFCEIFEKLAGLVVGGCVCVGGGGGISRFDCLAA